MDALVIMINVIEPKSRYERIRRAMRARDLFRQYGIVAMPPYVIVNQQN